jgi:hypothetical protein
MKCPHCNSTSLSPSEFQVLLLSNPPQLQYICNDCGEYSSQYEFSEKHMNTESEEPKIVIGSHQYSLEESYAIEFAKRKIQRIRDEIYDELFGKLKTYSPYEGNYAEIHKHLTNLIKYINE